jgi:prepilin-type N-terminal cleavage/methylation domain-containing protein
MNDRGFTFVELVIVVVLLGTLSAVALPKFFDISVDARRSMNNTIVKALNASIDATMGRANIISAIITGTGAAALTNGASTVNPLLINLDNNSNSNILNNYVGISSIKNPIPVGGGRNVNSATPTLTATASAGRFPYADILTAANGGPYLGCINLFNVLVSDDSVTAGSVSSSNYQNITAGSTPIKAPITFTSINGSSAFTTINTSISARVISAAAIAAAAVPGTSGVCVYLQTSSATATVKFYIIYDAAMATFYSAESN